MPSDYSLTLNGTFAAVVDGRGVAFAHRRTERLLAYLALNGPSDRVGVARALWPGVDRERALASLRQALRAVALEGGDGWIVADRRVLRLDARVTVQRGEGRLLEGWDEAWIGDRRPPEEAEPPVDALFGLVAWYRDRDPETAFGMVAEAQTVLDAAPAARRAREIGPLLDRLVRLPENPVGVFHSVARAYYLTGELGKAHALYGRLAAELPRPRQAGTALGARLSQVVILRESGATGAAARLAERVLAEREDTTLPEWVARYHLGLAQHLGGHPDGLRTARAAIESAYDAGETLTRLFPFLNVAEGLIDAGEPAALDYLREAARLAATLGDPLGLLSVEMLEGLWLAREDPEAALAGFRVLEGRAWETRLVPFAASLADRAALLAHRLGRRDEARRLLSRGDRVRRRLALQRAPTEVMRLTPLRGV